MRRQGTPPDRARRIAALAGLPLALACACPSLGDGSSELATSALRLDVDAVDEGEGELVVTARVSTHRALVPGTGAAPVGVALDDGDRLEVTHGGATQALRPVLASPGEHSARVPARPGEPVRVALRRRDHAAATESVVTLPERFTLLAPGPARLSRGGDALEVRWAPAVPIELALRPAIPGPSGACFRALTRTFRDGTARIEPGTLRGAPYVDAGPARGCLATLSLTHTVTGTLDPALAGGAIRARQRASRNLPTDP
ncbi:MAG: hypothetical protein KF729_24465 [Sandaracinaceae bacterium]|nr:hypothetical protein [Sandaracinaceae bacterium]